jgi:hypothetical protein
MPDNKDLRSGGDRERIAADQEHEVNYMAEKLNVSAEEVRQAIAQVGNSREKVEEHLRNRRR